MPKDETMPTEEKPRRTPADLMTPLQAARVLGVGPDRVRQMANKGLLHVVMVAGRRHFWKDHVEKLMTQGWRRKPGTAKDG